MSLVADVLDGDAIEDEAVRVEPETFAVGALCDDIVAAALPMIEGNGNRFAMVCPPRDRLVRTDPRKLRQIVINLLGNAGKFTRDGSVRLEVHLDEGAHDDALRIVVRDTGVGIPDDVMERLFTEYEQGDATVPARFGGTGIGLALSRHFCILLGGEITATSRPGLGSTFTVIVPVEIDPASPRKGRQDMLNLPGTA